MIQEIYKGDTLNHRWFSLHKRLPRKRDESYNPEPPTYWLVITMPWRRKMYSINIDDIAPLRPTYWFGFRFHKSGRA